MLEGLVTWVLNNYIGEYLENLNADQLSVALLQGQVELENVPLKKTALRKFDIPLQVKSGIIGKLTLSVPMTRMRSEPWILKMSDLLILLSPSDGNFDASNVEGYEQSKKEQLLEALESYHKTQMSFNMGMPLKDEATQNQYWGASLVSAVTNNIQLILSNVHIRYEDSTTMPTKTPFTFGIRIQHISIQTTNAQWKPEFIQPVEGVNVFKKLDIKGFSVFWNCNQEAHTDLSSYADLKAAMSPESSKENQFILQPFSMQARMEKNSSKFPLKTVPAIPRFKFDLRPEKINIELSKKQLAQIRVLSREWARFDRARQHRKWRPLVAPKGNAKAWWKFAIGRVMDETQRNSQRCTLKFLLTRATHLNLYCKAYKQKLEAFIADQQNSKPSSARRNSATGAPVTGNSSDAVFMKQIEHDSQYSYHELHLFREIVFRRLMRQKEDERKVASENSSDAEKSTPEPFEVVTPTVELTRPPLAAANDAAAADRSQGVYGWISSWFGSDPSKEEKPAEDDINEASFLQMWPNFENKELPPNLKRIEKKVEEEIMDVLNESWDDSTVLRRDNLLAEIVLQLERIIIRFIDDDVGNGSSRVIAMDWRQVASRVQLSPREHRTEISLSVGDMSVQRLKIEPSVDLNASEGGGGKKEDDELKSFTASDEDTDDDDALIFGAFPKFTPQLLFAIGRAKEETVEGGENIPDQHHDNFVLMTEGKQKTKKPLFQMQYRRMAPRLNVLHELDAKFSSISVIYDEDAVNGLSNFFDTETALIQNTKDLANIDFEDLGIVGETHCYMNFSIPSVLLELRSRRTSLANKEPGLISSPFACAKITNVDLGISKTEPMLTRLKVNLSSLVVDDLYEKNSAMPLIRTIEKKNNDFANSANLSNSCPNLNKEESAHFTTLSSSLPTLLEFKPVFIQKPPQLPLATRLPIKDKAPPKVVIDDDFGFHAPDGPLLNFVFVDSDHPEYESKYAKRNCIVDAEFSGVDFAINRRTWTMLLDFFGALGVKTPSPEDGSDDIFAGTAFDEKDLKLLYGNAENIPDVFKKEEAHLSKPKQAKEDYLFHLKLAISAARIYMMYPKNQTQLGTILLNSAAFDVKVNLKDVQQPMLLKILATELFIHDETPFYSRFYTERLTLKSANLKKGGEESRKLRIDVVKYRTDDPDLKRDCDMKIDMQVEKDCQLCYIHTHRFFCGIMDFWFNFAELQDQVRRTNENIGIPEEQQKMRTLIKIDLLGGTSLILPLNQFSDQVILLQTSNISLSNRFQLGSQTPELNEQCVENKFDIYNCLLEKMEVKFAAVSIHDGYRVSVDQECPAELKQAFPREVGFGIFQNYYFAVHQDGILTRKCDLMVGVYRNISGLISHNTPDLTILTKFENIDLLFSTDFYCLLRGFLEKNLGEQLIPVPDTIPTEVLQNPDRGYTIESIEKYPAFSFRLTFINVQFHFLVPQNPRFPKPGKFKKFGRMILHKARISYDSSIDSSAEFDLICESTELVDTRFEDLKGAESENAFPTILTSRENQKCQEGNFMKLMSEAHIMMKKDEAPTVTLVLQNSRIILILDWLNNAKDFFLLNTTFVPPEEPSTQKGMYGFPKDGILTRAISNPRPSPLHTITLKITLRDSDLLLLEQTNNPSSLALICFTTAVLNLNDCYGVFEANLEVQKLNCAWCIMSSQDQTRCQISNDFTATISVKREIIPAFTQAQALLNGLTQAAIFSVNQLPKQIVNIELGQLVARISYKDMLVLNHVFMGSIDRLKHSFENSLIPKLGHQPPGRPPFIFQKAYFSSEHLCFWFLDDSQGVALPMLRLILSSVHLDTIIGENLSSNFQLSIDYFNQLVYGWEPFIEPWQIKEFNLNWKSNCLHLGLKPDPLSPLDINVTQTLIQQMKQFHSKWPLHKKTLDRDFRNFCIRSRADHLPYLLRNETGSNILFTTHVEEITKARIAQQKSNAKWFSVSVDKNCTFEFPTKRLIAKEKSNEPRQMIVRVDGWDEISPVDVDSVGTYFRVTRMAGSSSKRDALRARIVVAVTMDADGRKVVTIRSALLAVNELPDPIILRFFDSSSRSKSTEFPIPSGTRLSIPLKFVNSEMDVRPSLTTSSSSAAVSGQPVDWRIAKTSDEVINQQLQYKTGTKKDQIYWICVSIKRDNYPEYESLSGHTMIFVPPMTLTNLLPVEIEFFIETTTKQSYRVGAGDRFELPYANPEEQIFISIRSEQFNTIRPVMLQRSQFVEKSIHEDRRISLPMMDRHNRLLDLYGSVYIGRGGSLQISLWVPYWIVNRSGIPLIIKQEATDSDAAGQFDDHERAKDRNPLMFSFADQNCPKQCVVRVGKFFENDAEYKPQYSEKVSLSSGVQALKLLLTHEFNATLMYDIGMEVRQCTGRYKNTQIVLFTPRYRLNNQSSTQLFVCHHEDVSRSSQHLQLASKSHFIWHENFEDKRRLCIRRADVAHWSYPFRIDQIGSFHVTMRDRDETPKFVRVEVALNGASFFVTFTDAFYFPAPIKIENHTNVPVLYQQASQGHTSRFRTICKANSTVDYFWDNLYDRKELTLQVYENKSHNYDPTKPKRGPQLKYDNYLYIQFTPSFSRTHNRDDVETEEHELVLEARVNGKVVLNKMNVVDSSHRQLWKRLSDGTIENVGMNHTSKNGEKFVLDILENNGNALMVVKQDPQKLQTWEFSKEGTLMYCNKRNMVVEVIDRNKLALKLFTGMPTKNQLFNYQRQKPGSGTLDVECLHIGPSLVIRITDHFDTSKSSLALPSQNDSRSRSPGTASTVLSQRRSQSSSSNELIQYYNFDGEIHMPAGIGISLVNDVAEELIYARFQGVQMHFCRIEKTYQITGYVNVVQIDNQTLTTDRWQVLYCHTNAIKGTDDDKSDISSPTGSESSSITVRPALKLEMNYTPMEHYDAFDCFRVKLCDMCILLDETLLWKLLQFIQQTGTSDVVSKTSMIQPPNIEPDMSAPGLSDSDGTPIRRCYFGTLDLEVGNVALTVLTVAKNGLSKDLQTLKRQFNIKLVSFENAIVTLPPFRQFHYFETLQFLVEALSKFYMMELQKQTINIVFTMDAFGNPRGLATDLKDSFQGLVFEADITGFVYGLGYGVTNSISKVASSMSHGIGSFTFDEQHELMRKRMMRIQPSSSDSSAAFSHFCNGVKGFGVGVFGGLTAIVGNTTKAMKKDGVMGFPKGIVTGVVDTVTKPTQGMLDLVEGTASALKEAVGSHSSRKSRFSESRIRLPRVCTNLQSLLPVYSSKMAEAQQELLRINGYSTNEVLFDVEVILRHQTHDHIEQRVLICSEQCYCLRQINDSPASVTQRIPYRCFKNIFIDPNTDVGKGFICIGVSYDTTQKSMSTPRLVCGDKETARRLCEKVLRAKQLYDHSKRTLSITEEFDYDPMESSL